MQCASLTRIFHHSPHDLSFLFCFSTAATYLLHFDIASNLFQEIILLEAKIITQNCF
jgi:hypothetical protein